MNLKLPAKITKEETEQLSANTNISYKDHVTNEEVCTEIQHASGPHEDLLTIVKRRKLMWYGRASLHSSLAKAILQSTMIQTSSLVPCQSPNFPQDCMLLFQRHLPLLISLTLYICTLLLDLFAPVSTPASSKFHSISAEQKVIVLSLTLVLLSGTHHFGPTVWNSMPLHIRNATTKSALKTYLFNFQESD